MANYITGSTDTGNNLNTRATLTNSVLIVGKGAPSAATEKIVQINGTTDAATYFGAESLVVEMVKTLIQNGANNIKGIMVGEFGDSKTYTSADEAYTAALKVTLKDNNIRIIILDGTDTESLNTVLKTHLAEAEANDMYRYGVIGMPVGTDDATYISTAKTIKDKRIFLAGPNVVDDTNTEKDGAITAAGLAALMLTETSDPALPLNSVAINGYSGVIRTLMRTERNNLATGGVTAIYPDEGKPVVWRLVTTDTEDDGVWSEGTTIMIADDVLSSVIARLKANYKRTKNVTRVLSSIKTDVIDVLEGKEGLEIIKNFDRDTVSVVQDPEDKYGALVDYEIEVVTPLYTITISQHLKV